MSSQESAIIQSRHIASWKILAIQGQIMEKQNFFVYSNENEGMLVLVLYSYNNKQVRTVYYEFIMGSKHEVLRSKAKL